LQNRCVSAHSNHADISISPATICIENDCKSTYQFQGKFAANAVRHIDLEKASSFLACFISLYKLC
jgi:hypothetical protein